MTNAPNPSEPTNEELAQMCDDATAGFSETGMRQAAARLRAINSALLLLEHYSCPENIDSAIRLLRGGA